MKKLTLLLIVLICGFAVLLVVARNMSAIGTSSENGSEMPTTVVTNMVTNTIAVTNIVVVTKEQVADKKESRRVALVVQNHTSDAPTLPMAAFADTLASRLSGSTIRIVNPHNVIGVNQNRSATGEAMPEASAQEIGRMLGADGVVTAAIQEFTGEDIGVPAVAHTLKVRLALNLADAATGETVCGVDGVEFSKNYTAEKVNSGTATLYEGLMHAAAAKGAEKLLAKVAASGWTPAKADVAHVNFTCNIQGADVKIDGVAMGTVPAMIEVPKGVHNLVVEYPFCVPYATKAFFSDGQTYNIVLQLDATGRERFKSEALFAETLDRIRKTGATDDYVRRTLADGTAQYWKNSGVKIDKGEVKDLKLDPPGGAETVAPKSPTVDQLMEKSREL